MAILPKTRTASLAAAFVAALLATTSVEAADNDDSGPTPDVGALCSATAAMCQEACSAAVYTGSQRRECGARCQAALEQCLKGEAARSRNKNTVGKKGTSVLRQ